MAAVALPSYASSFTLNFEGLLDSETIGNYYNGGLGGSGSGPGTNFGVTFSSDATAFIQNNQSVLGGVTDTGLFGGEPSPYTVMLFCDASQAAPCNGLTSPQTIDVAGGFNSGFSLYYSAPFSAGQFDIFSGLDGGGTDLTPGGVALPLTPAGDAGSNPGPNQPADNNCDGYGNASNPGVPFCPFVPVSVSFSGTAESVVFTGATNLIAFDDMTFGAPEPATWLLIGTGLAGIALYRRKHALAR
jgi:hypothetical protein